MQYHECTKVNGKLKFSIRNLKATKCCYYFVAHLQQLKNQTGQQDPQTLQYVTRKEVLEQDLNRRASFIIISKVLNLLKNMFQVAGLMELRIKITDKLRITYQNLAQLQSQIIDDELIRWKREQQLSGNGVPFNSNLDQIQDW